MLCTVHHMLEYALLPAVSPPFCPLHRFRLTRCQKRLFQENTQPDLEQFEDSLWHLVLIGPVPGILDPLRRDSHPLPHRSG